MTSDAGSNILQEFSSDSVASDIIRSRGDEIQGIAFKITAKIIIN